MPPDLPALIDLQQKGVPYRLFEHSGPVNSLEQAAQERGEAPEQVVRSILFRLAAQSYLMALMPGPRQIAWKNLRQLTGQNRLTKAADEEVFQVTGCRPGTVNPFGLPRPLRILADRALLTLPEISFGSGRRGLAILIQPADLLRAYPQIELVDL